jgi:hypothetical protein
MVGQLRGETRRSFASSTPMVSGESPTRTEMTPRRQSTRNSKRGEEAFTIPRDRRSFVLLSATPRPAVTCILQRKAGQ